MQRSSSRTVVVAAALAVGLSFAPALRAAPAPSDSDRADALFRQGLALMDEGKYAPAGRMFEETLRVDPTAMAARFRLAECYEKMSRLADARSLFAEVARAAKENGQSERESVARARAEALLPRLAAVIIRLGLGASTLPKLRVSLDGADVPNAMWNGAVLHVDPGEHVLVATAPERLPYRVRLTLDTPGKSTEVVVPQLEAANSAPTARDASQTPGFWTPGRITATVWASAGASVLVAGILVPSTAQKDPTTGQTERTFGAAKSGFLAAGVAGLVSAIPMWLLGAPASHSQKRAAVRVAPVLGPGTSGGLFMGEF